VPDRAAHDIVDVEHPAGVLRADAPLLEREYAPLGDDEQAAQLREPGDHVVRECVADPAGNPRRSDRFGERHHRNGGAARRRRRYAA
jgi:hypothetical protein